MNNPSRSFEFLRLWPGLATDPGSGRESEIYYNTTTKTIRVFDGSSWVDVGGTFANQHLSNLIGPTAINADLIPDNPLVRNLGSLATPWSRADIYNLSSVNSVNGSYGNGLTIDTMSTTGTDVSGGINLSTGDTVGGNSGSILIRAGLPAGGTTVYTQQNSSFGSTAFNFSSFTFGVQLAGIQMVAGSNATLSGVTFKLQNGTGTPDSFTSQVYVYSDNSGQPGTLITSSAVVGLTLAGSATQDQLYTFNVPVGVQSGNTYYFILAAAGSVSTLNMLGSSSSVGAQNFTSSTNSGATWTTTSAPDPYFILYTAPLRGTIDLGSSAVRLLNQTPIRLYDNDSSNYVGFTAPAALSVNTTWTLPSADGTIGQVLATDGSGTLAWVTAATADVSDSVFRIHDNGDISKKLAFEVSAISPSTVRTWTVPDSNLNFSTGIGGSFANNTLSNLAAPTAINVDLLPVANLYSTLLDIYYSSTNISNSVPLNLTWGDYFSGTTGTFNATRFHMSQTGATGTIVSKVFLTNGGAVGTLVATSDPVSIASIGAGISPVLFTFSSPVSISSANGYIVGVFTSDLSGTLTIYGDNTSNRGVVTTGNAASYGGASPGIQLLTGSGSTINLGNATQAFNDIFVTKALDVSGFTEIDLTNRKLVDNANVDAVGWSGTSVEILPKAGVARDIKLWDGSTTNYIKIKAPNSGLTNTTYTLPSADGTTGQFLKTNGSGILSFATVTNASGVAGSIQLSDGSGNLIDDGSNFLWDTTTKRLFMGTNASIAGSNAGIQYSNAAVANRAQIKLHSYFAGSSIAGVSTLTSASGTIGTNNAIAVGQDYSKWTAQASASTVGSAPISGTWAFKSNAVNSLTVPSDFHISLTNAAGTLGDRLYLTSEGVMTLSGGQGQIKLTDAGGSNFVSLRAPSSVASSVTWTMPNADGTSGQFLSTDGLGLLSWQTVAVPTGVTPNVEYRTLTSGEASANQLTLATAPFAPTKVLLDILDGGGSQEYGVEFTVSGTTLSWASGPLAGTLTTINRMRITYWT